MPRHLQFYSPAYILAPSTITTTAVSLAASSLFYKQADFAANTAPTPTSKSSAQHQMSWSSGNPNGGTGECVTGLPHFIQLTLSNSHYGFLNSQSSYNYNLSELIANQQQLLAGGLSSLSLLVNGTGAASASGAVGVGGVVGPQSQSSANNGYVFKFQFWPPHYRLFEKLSKMK